ncbi:uncharacterized protein DUF4191 [Kineococcus xinjiangensis]|uniref:Uncharacterized protein DUF4191 n=1 Tax=Kineococcus xinjiangensis TaxID=512762 RepID=A0A2S6IM75_9ACTN|nr:DUF4191 domain-containing protein [Kineococcus xinjiangensis]PPK95337.1 uncharacterized protein DUF4191 [Kineococcus xinjiangensis]
MARTKSSPEPAPTAKPRWRRGRGSSPAPGRRQGRLKQIRAVYRMTVKADPATRWWLLLAFGLPLVLSIVIGILSGHWIYFPLLGLMIGLLAATFVLSQRAQKAAFRQIEGQPGATGATLSTLRRGWNFEQEPVAMNPRTRDMVFRAVGRPGVVLVGEGPAPRVRRLVEDERRKVNRLVPNVEVHTIYAGDGEDQVPLRKLPRTLTRLRPKLTKQEVEHVTKRLRAMGAVKPPIPKGIDPMRARPDRKATRGR